MSAEFRDWAARPQLPGRHLTLLCQFADLRAKTRCSTNRSTARKNVAPTSSPAVLGVDSPVTHASVTPLHDVVRADGRSRRSQGSFPQHVSTQIRMRKVTK